MGGPWKCRDFDPVAWRPPDPHVEAQPSDPESQDAHDNLIGIVIGYVVSVVALSGLTLTLVVKFGYGW